jgi:hypothetical protein
VVKSKVYGKFTKIINSIINIYEITFETKRKGLGSDRDSNGGIASRGDPTIYKKNMIQVDNSGVGSPRESPTRIVVESRCLTATISAPNRPQKIRDVGST